MDKVFTVEQANRTLPLVRRIVEDLVRQYTHWQERLTASEVASAGTGDARLREAERLQKEVQALAAEIEGYVEELASLGAEAKQPLDSGLVDFPGEVEGRRVYLCWRLGEDAIRYWHDLDAGYPGRRPLSPTPARAESQ
jgi:hypothetical protein